MNYDCFIEYKLRKKCSLVAPVWRLLSKVYCNRITSFAEMAEWSGMARVLFVR